MPQGLRKALRAVALITIAVGAAGIVWEAAGALAAILARDPGPAAATASVPPAVVAAELTLTDEQLGSVDVGLDREGKDGGEWGLAHRDNDPAALTVTYGGGEVCQGSLVPYGPASEATLADEVGKEVREQDERHLLVKYDEGPVVAFVLLDKERDLGVCLSCLDEHSLSESVRRLWPASAGGPDEGKEDGKEGNEGEKAGEKAPADEAADEGTGAGEAKG